MGASRTPIKLGVVALLAVLVLPFPARVSAGSRALAAVTPLSPPAIATPPLATAASADAEVPALILATIRLGHHRLIRVPLDGVNEPQLLADMEGPADAEYAPQWSIAPDGRTALHLTGRGSGASLIDLDTAVRRDLDPQLHLSASDTPPVWSADSSRVALGGVILDTTSASAVRLDAGDLQLRGFDPSGRLILWTSSDDAGGQRTWTFFRWDPATPDLAPAPIPLSEAAVVEGVPDPVSVPLRSAVEHGQPVEGRDGLGLRSLDDGAFTPFADLPHGYGQGVFDPTGQVVVARIGSRLWVVRPDGSTGLLLDRDAHDDAYVDPAAIRFTPDASLIAFQPGYRADTIVVHEVATGRTVSVPMPRDVALAQLVRVTGSDPLRLLPLAHPVAAPPPEEPATGTVVPGSPLVVSERIDRPEGSSARYSIALGRPASRGVVRTLASHDFPIPLGSETKPQVAGVVAGPGPDAVTIWTGWGAERRTWTWRLVEEPRRIALPVPFRRSTDLTWSPDGSTLAAHLRDSGRAIQLWNRRSGRYRLLPIPAPYRGGDIDRWTRDGRSLVIAPWVCSDTCEPPAPNAMLVLPTDGGRPSRIQPDGWYAWDPEGRRLELRRFWHRPGRVRVTLPPGIRTAPSAAVAATTDGRSLWVLTTRGSDRLLLRYDRPWDQVTTPARKGLPTEVTWISQPEVGWLSVTGEGTLGCRPREGLVRPNTGRVHWVGACRRIALVLPWTATLLHVDVSAVQPTADQPSRPSPSVRPAPSASPEPSPIVVQPPAAFPWPTIPAPVEDPDAELDLVPFTPSGPPAATARRHGVVVQMWLSSPSVGQGEWIQALVRTTNTRADPVWMWPGECLWSSTSIGVDLSSVIRPGVVQEGKAAAYKQHAIRASGALRSGFQAWHPRPSANGVQVSAWAECGGYTFPSGWLKLRPGATTEERLVWYPARLMDVRRVRWQPLPPGTVTVEAAWHYVGHGSRPRPGREDRPVHPIVVRAALRLTGIDPGTPSVPELIDSALADAAFGAWAEAHPDDQRGWSADVTGWPGPGYPAFQPRWAGLAGKAPNGFTEIWLDQRVPGVDHLIGVALVDPWTGEVVDVGFE